MAEDELAQVMLGFAQGSTMCCCTTIIESGLTSRCDTVIIDRRYLWVGTALPARGRVGRGGPRLPLLYKQPLSEIAEKRLQTIRRRATWALGSGGVRDIEIRGAGETWRRAARLHCRIGFDLYVRLCSMPWRSCAVRRASP